MFTERSSQRLKEGWHKLKGWRGSYVRDLMGHHLVIFHGRVPDDPHWYKWVDGHFRGSAETLSVAKDQLVREAQGGGMAWGSKLEREATHVNAVSSTPLVCGPLHTLSSQSRATATADVQPLSAMEELLKPVVPEVVEMLTITVVGNAKGESDESPMASA